MLDGTAVRSLPRRLEPHAAGMLEGAQCPRFSVRCLSLGKNDETGKAERESLAAPFNETDYFNNGAPLMM